MTPGPTVKPGSEADGVRSSAERVVLTINAGSRSQRFQLRSHPRGGVVVPRDFRHHGACFGLPPASREATGPGHEHEVLLVHQCVVRRPGQRAHVSDVSRRRHRAPRLELEPAGAGAGVRRCARPRADGHLARRGLFRGGHLHRQRPQLHGKIHLRTGQGEHASLCRIRRPIRVSDFAPLLGLVALLFFSRWQVLESNGKPSSYAGGLPKFDWPGPPL